MALGRFIRNTEYGKTHQQLSSEIGEVTAETRKRQANGLDTDDQQWRESHLREARGRLN